MPVFVSTESGKRSPSVSSAGLLPNVTSSLSRLGQLSALVPVKRTSLLPARSVTLTVTVLQASHDDVAGKGKLALITVPFTLSCATRFLIVEKRKASCADPACGAFTCHSTRLPTALLVFA